MKNHDHLTAYGQYLKQKERRQNQLCGMFIQYEKISIIMVSTSAFFNFYKILSIDRLEKLANLVGI